MLSAAEWAPLFLSDLVGQIVQAALQMVPRDKRVDLELPKSTVRVTPEQSHSLALLINELATNSVKHALQERDSLRIGVAISNQDNTIVLQYSDDGPGFPDHVLAQNEYNVGLYLLENITRHDLAGEIRFFNENGAVTEIRFSQSVSEYAIFDD
jgi:two-component sensor histidine kinase